MDVLSFFLPIDRKSWENFDHDTEKYHDLTNSKEPSDYYVKCRCRGKHRSREISEKACELIQTREGSEKLSDSKRQQDLMPGYM